MRELWVLHGRVPVIWRLPVYVTWTGDKSSGQIDAGVHFFQHWWAAVNQLLGLHGERKGKQWQISEFSLKQIGEITKGGDPELLVMWGSPRPPDRRADAERIERDAFIDDYLGRGGGLGLDRAVLITLWRELCAHAAHWMINKEKPLDLHFIRLHNCPYRANWRTILTQRFRRLGPTLHHMSGVDREFAIVRSGIRDELLSLDLLSFNRNTRTCYRHIEVEHRKSWWKLVLRVERERLLQKGPEGYAEYFIDSLRRFVKPALTLYTSWLAQIASPCVADCESGPDGRIRLVPNHLAGALSPSSAEYFGLAPVIPNKRPRYKPASAAATLFGEDGGVPEMSDLQPSAQDVRERANKAEGPAMVEPGDGKD
jgi:hypothetical protein